MKALRSSAVSPILLLIFLSLGSLASPAQSFQHPGVVVSKAQLDYVKAMVQAHVEPFYSAFIKMQNSSSGSLTFTPQGPPTSTGGIIECGPTSNPNIGCSAADDDSTAAYEQALLWYITGNHTYADNAIKTLNLYAYNMKGYGPKATYSNTPLQAAWDAQKWPRAAEIIRYSNAGWADADQQAFAQILTNYMLPQLVNGSTSNGNWETSMIEGLINIGVYTDDAATFNLGVKYWKQRVPAYFYYHTDGASPVPAPRGTANWYGQSVYDPSVDGVSQESCRDFGHAQYGVSGVLDAAETAYIQGVDLYNDSSSNALNRMTSALEFHAYYLLNNPVPTSVCGGTVTLQVYPVDEIGYNAYHNRLGIALPITQQYLQNTIRKLADPTEFHIMVYESLTHGGDASQMPAFLLYTANSTATVQTGKNATSSVQVIAGNNPTGTVALSLSGLPTGTSYSFSPATVSGAGSSTLTITTTSAAKAGSYPLTITGTGVDNKGNAATYTNALSLILNLPSSDFSIAVTPQSTVLVAGDTAQMSTTFTPLNSYTGSAALSIAGGLPAGATAAFTPATVTNATPTSVLTVTTAGSTTPDAYNLTVQATDGNLTHSAQAVLVVSSIQNACINQVGATWTNNTLATQTGTFTVQWDSAPSTSVNNSVVGFSLGAQTAYTGYAVAARFNPTGTIDARNGSAYVAMNTLPYTAGTLYHFRAVVNVAANTYSLYVTPPAQSEVVIGQDYAFRAEQAGITAIDHWDAYSSVGTISICNLMVDAPDFLLAATPSAQAITAGSPASVALKVTPMSGYTAANIALSASGLPTGATATFTPATLSTSATTSNLVITTSASTPTGVYAVKVTATDGTNAHVAYPELTVNAPCLAPTAIAQSLNVTQNSAVAVNLTGTLGSGCASTDKLSYTVTVQPTHGVLTGTVPYLMYTPTAGYTGSDSMSFTVADSNATTTTSAAAQVKFAVIAAGAGIPTVSSVQPLVLKVNSATRLLTINGTGFTATSSVLVNGTSRTTTYISAMQITAAITASDVQASGVLPFTVSNTASGGGISPTYELAIDTTDGVGFGIQPGQVSVTHGQAVSFQVALSGTSASTQTTVTCYNLPTAANCSFNQQTLTLAITTGTTTPAGTYPVLIVSNTAATQKASSGAASSAGYLCILLGLPLGLLVRKQRRSFLVLLVALGLGLAMLQGCGAASPGVTATTSSQTSTTLTLTVN